MRILRITRQHRRDFSAILICESCKSEETLTTGYDDDHYHKNVIPAMKCESCGKSATSDYMPQATKHSPFEVV